MNKSITFLCCVFLSVATVPAMLAQGYWDGLKEKKATLGIESGYLNLETNAFLLKLVKASQTVAGLAPLTDSIFDFTPGDRLTIRDKDSLYHLGDLNLSIRQGTEKWQHYSTAYQRKPVTALPVSGNILAAADLSPTLPADIPLKIKRFYEKEADAIILRFEITNSINTPVEVGALGIPMIFNNILEGKTLDETHAQNVFFDPYIGKDAGYLEVKRLNGQGPVLVVLPEENMAFEAYRPLLDDLTRKSIVFEGFHEWMSFSKAYAENEWKGVTQWNAPTSIMLQPGTVHNFSIKLVLSNAIRDVQKTLKQYHKPTAISVPGYVLPQDVKTNLFIDHTAAPVSLTVEPQGALTIQYIGPNPNGYEQYAVQGLKWGNARLTLTYPDSLQQTIHYKVIKTEAETVKDYGHFLTTQQWFDDPQDPFHRNPSVISYDYEEKKQVTQDSRAWIAGLSDEGGAGSWLGAIMKQSVLPDKKELKKLEDFVNQTLWGGIQYDEGETKYGVRKSIFYYEPDLMPKGTYSPAINYGTWAAWNKKGADDPGRSYNYPHVTAAYWVMYRLARYHEGLVTQKPWEHYLQDAYHTAVAMTQFAPYYSQFGQMEGTIFLLVLQDLKNEGYDEMAADLEAKMRARAEHWRSLNYPFGSEMPWDSTGQEEVYMWSDYFGFDAKAQITLNAILAYMPTMPHWAYNGNARRYWDFLYGGKLSRVERQIHHYGSGLNAIPVLKQYRKTPEDFHLLQVGYGGVMGAISNITQDGFGPSAFHSFPATLAIDGLSGDYGSGFFGYAINSATYITPHPELGWLAFGGNLTQSKKIITVELTTASKNKIYLASEKLWLTLDAGTFKSIRYNMKSKEIELLLNPKTEYTPMAYLRINKEIPLSYSQKAGAYQIPLTQKEQTLKLKL